MLKLIDGNNQFKRLFHAIGPGAMESLFLEALYPQPGNTLVWIWDGKNANARRRAQFPGYKHSDGHVADDFYQTTDLFKQVLGHSAAIQLEVDGYEADDVIATLAQGTEDQVTIQSTDQDYYQIESSRIRILTEKERKMDADDIRLFKTLVGDKSDCIPGLTRFGETGFKKLLPSERQVLKSFFRGQSEHSAEEVAQFLEWKGKTLENWLAEQDQLRVFWNIIGFYSVPLELMSAAMKPGVPNLQAGTALLHKYMLTMPTMAEAV
jgi:5'-3' exonuclease